MIAVDKLYFGYPRGGFRLGVSRLEVADGEPVAIMGAGGSGKSMLQELLARIRVPASGTVTVAGGRGRAA